MSRLLAVIVLLFASFPATAQQVRTDPSQPQAGQPFQLTVSGFWRDSVPPVVREVFLNGLDVIVVTLGADGNGDAVVTPFTARADIPALAAGTYRVLSRVADGAIVKPYGSAMITVAGTQPVFTPLDTMIGGTAGGSTVSFVHAGCPNHDCAGAQVFFGDKQSTNVTYTGDVITALVPSSTRVGPVDVRIKVGDRDDVRPSEFTYISPAQYETILLPSFTEQDIPGAFGSLWRVEHGVYNDNEISLEAYVDFMHVEYDCPTLCIAPQMIAAKHVNPVPTMFNFTRRPDWLIHVRKPADAALRWSLRVRDLSRQWETWGTELPVARERDFASRQQRFDIPLQPRFRQTVRIYALTQGTNCCTNVTVRFYSISDGTLLHETATQLQLAPVGAGLPDFPV
ncbi:MAG: hypothetical protein ACLGH0_14155, partial [Thermoanaerobaculia bacterium]